MRLPPGVVRIPRRRHGQQQIDQIEGALHGAGPLQLLGHVDQNLFTCVDRNIEKDALGGQQEV